MPIEVRTIDPAETARWLACLRTGFHATWAVEPIAQEVLTLWDYGRVWAAMDDEAMVGTARTWATELTVPGGARLPASAIAAVSVLPTQRRRGVLRRLMATELAAARARGESMAVLWASNAAIYGRFGFGPATRSATWTIQAASAAVPGAPRRDALAEMAPSPAARDVIRGVFEAWRARQPGEIRRREFTWDDALGLRPNVRGDEAWAGTLVVHRDATGDADGYVRYHLESRWERGQVMGVLHVDELHALLDEAYRDLWRFVCGLEWVATVRAEQRSPQEPLPWLLGDMRAAQPESIADGLWLALLDVPAAFEARRYERSGRVVLGLAAEDGSIERVALDATPDGAVRRATGSSPDVVVDRGALAAAYLGGVPLRHATLARGADEHRPGALAQLDGLPRTLDPPWCSTYF